VGKHGTAKQVTDEDVIRRMHIAGCITKATNTHSECVIFIAVPQQRWSRERTWMLCYTYIARLVPLLPSKKKKSWKRAENRNRAHFEVATEVMLIEVVLCKVEYWSPRTWFCRMYLSCIWNKATIKVYIFWGQKYIFNFSYMFWPSPPFSWIPL